VPQQCGSLTYCLIDEIEAEQPKDKRIAKAAKRARDAVTSTRPTGPR